MFILTLYVTSYDTCLYFFGYAWILATVDSYTIVVSVILIWEVQFLTVLFTRSGNHPLVNVFQKRIRNTSVNLFFDFNTTEDDGLVTRSEIS